MTNKKSKVKNRREKLKEATKKERKKPLTKKKLDELAEIKDIEEFYHIIEVLKEKDFNKFIDHYKNKSQNNEIIEIIKKSKDKKELLILLKQKIIAYLKEKQSEIERKLSEKRKQGKDLYMQSLKYMSIPLKIKIYEATLQKKDLYRIKNIIDDLEKDLLEVR